MKLFCLLKLAVIGFAVAGCDSSNTLGPPPDLEYAAATLERATWFNTNRLCL